MMKLTKEQRGLVYSEKEEENTEKIYEIAARLRKEKLRRKQGESKDTGHIPQLVSSHINGSVRFLSSKSKYGE